MRKSFMIAVTGVAALGALAAGGIRPALAATRATHILSAVACPAVRDCIAVGGSVPAGKPEVPLATRWNGVKWSPLAVPLPAGTTYGELTALSCASVKSCLALGDYQTRKASAVLAEIWNGTRWKLVAGLAPGGSPTVNDVSCVSATSCLATGTTNPPLGVISPFVAHWNGARWSVARLALPKGASGAFTTAVSCVSASWCQVALNSYVTKNFGLVSQAPYAYTWNGRAWSAAKLAIAASNVLPTIGDDVCLKATECVAIGQSLPAGGWHTETALFNGKTWRISTLAGSKVLMSAVACPAARSCLSAGSQGSDPYGNGGRPYVESWNGTSWRGAAAPAPRGTHATLDDIACASAGYCLAVGSTRGEGALNAAFADVWTGKAWKLTTAP